MGETSSHASLSLPLSPDPEGKVLPPLHECRLAPGMLLCLWTALLCSCGPLSASHKKLRGISQSFPLTMATILCQTFFLVKLLISHKAINGNISPGKERHASARQYKVIPNATDEQSTTSPWLIPNQAGFNVRHFSVGQASSHSGSSGILRIRSQCILLLSGIRCQEVPILLWSKLSRKFWARADRIYGTQTFESFSYSHLNHLSNLWDNKKSALY